MRLNEIYRAFHDSMDFYCVYIQEAHPDDGWQVASNLQDKVVHNQPATLGEREAMAQVCAVNLQLEMPMVLDGIDNEIDRLYDALPERLYVLDAEGRVHFRTVVGSPGFDVSAWEAAIAKLVGK